MKRFLIALCLLLVALCFAPACQAGGIRVAVGGLFAPRVAVQVGGFRQNAVVVNRGFFAPQRVQVFAAPRVHVQRQQFFVPQQSFGYGQSFNSFGGYGSSVQFQQQFAAPVYGGFGVQTFAAPGCGSFLSY